MTSGHDVFSRAEQEARVSRSGMILPESGPLSETQVDAVIVAAAKYLREQEITHGQLASAIRESETYVSNFLTARAELAAKTRDRIARAVVSWLEEDYRHRSVRSEGRFVHTVVAQRMFGMARNLKATRDMGLGYGGAGIGKTSCAQEITRCIAGTIYIRANKSCRTEAGLLLRLWRALRRTQRGRRTPAYEEIVAELKGTGCLLIIDQAHDLVDRALRLLMDLHDEADLPVMLLGTIDLRRRITADADPHFGQLSSRFGLKVNLLPEHLVGPGGRSGRWLTIAEVRQMFSGGKLKISRDALQMLLHLALTRLGALRVAQRVHRWAEFAAATEQRSEVSAADIQAALGWVDEDDPPPPPAGDGVDEARAATA